MGKINYCSYCNKTGENVVVYKMFLQNVDETILNNFFAGYIGGVENNFDKCPFCKNEIKKLDIETSDILLTGKASNYNRQLLDAMVDLHEKDIIEYELKMSQFRNLVEQQKQIKEESESKTKNESHIHCPYCNSTNINKISAIKKSASIIGFGILSKKIGKQWHCNNCKSDF